MLQRRVFFVLGLSFLFISSFIFLSSDAILTGYAISDNYDSSFNYSIIVWSLASSLILLFIGSQQTQVRTVEETSDLIEMLSKEVPAQSEVQVLLDADFIKSVQDNYRGQDKKLHLPPHYFGQNAVMPLKIYEELKYKGKQHGAPLVSDSTLNYLTNIQRVGVMPEQDISKNEESTIYQLWKTLTPQGRRANKQQEEHFLSSGDMDLLSTALRRGNKPTVILTNNLSEYVPIANALRSKGVDVYIHSIKDLKKSA